MSLGVDTHQQAHVLVALDEPGRLHLIFDPMSAEAPETRWCDTNSGDAAAHHAPNAGDAALRHGSRDARSSLLHCPRRTGEPCVLLSEATTAATSNGGTMCSEIRCNRPAERRRRRLDRLAAGPRWWCCWPCWLEGTAPTGSPRLRGIPSDQTPCRRTARCPTRGCCLGTGRPPARGSAAHLSWLVGTSVRELRGAVPATGAVAPHRRLPVAAAA